MSHSQGAGFGVGCLVFLFMIGLIAAVDAGLASLAQYAVEAFAGHPVGTWWAYFAAVVVISAVFGALRTSGKSS